MPNSQFWQKKKVLLTGHTGFKGSWLSMWLHLLGADVRGVSLAPDTSPSLFEVANVSECVDHQICDIRDYNTLKSVVDDFQPEIVLHLAAQALVRKSYAEPISTFQSNIMGTVNLLETLRNLSSVKVALIITTDKVYADCGGRIAYAESSPLGGHDPYSASKAACEIVIDSYRKSFLAANGVAVASARAGNVIGGGDWSEDRLLPDAVRAWVKEDTLQIRMPHAVRPWQHVLEPLAGYMALSELMWRDSEHAGAFNFGPPTENAVPVEFVIKLAREAFGRGEVIFSQTNPELHEADVLMLDTRKSTEVLDLVKPWSVSEAVNETMSWYKDFYQGGDPARLCIEAIERFEQRT